MHDQEMETPLSAKHAKGHEGMLKAPDNRVFLREPSRPSRIIVFFPG